MTPMICTAPHEYRQIDRSVGERFDVEDEHVFLLGAMGRAKLPDSSPTESTASSEPHQSRRRGSKAA